MPYTAAAEDVVVRGERQIPGSNETKKLWRGSGPRHAVEIDNPDSEPSQDATEQGVAACGAEDVWLMRVTWPGGTRADERCAECERLTGA